MDHEEDERNPKDASSGNEKASITDTPTEDQIYSAIDSDDDVSAEELFYRRIPEARHPKHFPEGGCHHINRIVEWPEVRCLSCYFVCVHGESNHLCEQCILQRRYIRQCKKDEDKRNKAENTGKNGTQTDPEDILAKDTPEPKGTLPSEDYWEMVPDPPPLPYPEMVPDPPPLPYPGNDPDAMLLAEPKERRTRTSRFVPVCAKKSGEKRTKKSRKSKKCKPDEARPYPPPGPKDQDSDSEGPSFRQHPVR